MKLKRAIGVIIILIKLLYAQDSAIDSLKNILNHTTNDTAKITTLLNLVEVVYDDDEWHTYNIQALQICNKIAGNTHLQGFINRSLSSIYNNEGYYAKHKNNYPKAMDYFLLSVKYAKLSKDFSSLIGTYINIASLLSTQKKYTESLDYYKQAITLGKKYNIGENELLYAYMSINALYSKVWKNYDSSEIYLKKTIQENKKINDKNIMGQAYNATAISLIEKYSQNNQQVPLIILDSAIHLHTIAQSYFNFLGNLQEVTNSYYNIVSLWQKKYIQTKNVHYLNIALNYTDSTLLYAKKSSGLSDLADVYHLRSILLESLAGTKANYSDKLSLLTRSFNNYKVYKMYSDSTLNKNLYENLTQKLLKYEYETKEIQLKADQEKKDTINKEERKRKNIILYTISIILILLIGFFILLYKNLQITKSQKQTIEQQKQVVEEKNKDILDSITYSKRIQNSILPKVDDITKLLPKNFILYLPKDIVAGDFYWYHQTENSIYIAAADCTGHGVPGALLSVFCSNVLTKTIKDLKITETGQILDTAHHLLVEQLSQSSDHLKDGMDISLCKIPIKYGAHTEIEWSGANNALWILSKNTITEIKPNKQPIGYTDNFVPFTTHKIQVNSTDRLYLFTDGFHDQFGGKKNKKLRAKLFQEYLSETTSLSITQQKEFLQQKLLEWKGNNEQTDDILVIGIEV